MRIPVARDEAGRVVFDERVADYVQEKLAEAIGAENIVNVRFASFPHERFVTVVVKPEKDAQATEVTSQVEEQLNALDPDLTILCLPEQPKLSLEEALEKFRESLQKAQALTRQLEKQSG